MSGFRMNGALLACCLAVAVSDVADAAEKTKPYPHYWMSVATSNQGMPGMSAEMSGFASLFGSKGAFGPRRDLLLQLESPQKPAGPPQAAHYVPPGQNMGESLPLKTPQAEKRDHEPTERERPDKFEKPKARMLIYWGCGETIGKGQPRVLDTAKMNPAEFGKAFAGRTPTRQAPPSPRTGWTYGEWPNSDDRSDIPRDSSLVGTHTVKGNYLPDIEFGLDKKRDFMAPVEFSPVQTTAAGAAKVEWKTIPTAIGYFATAMGHNQQSGDSIFWSSSEVPELGFTLQDYLTPADVSRFIKEKVVMEPSRTSCTVPPIFKEAQGAMLQFIGYGEELNLVYPPKPKNPKQPWDPKWSVKVRLKSTGMTPLMAMDDQEDGRARSKAGKGRTTRQNSDEGEAAGRGEGDSSGEKDKGIGNRLKGFFGF